MSDEEKLIKCYSAAKSLTRMTSFFSATGAVVETYLTGKPDFVSIGVFGISSSVLLLNEILVSKVEQEKTSEKPKEKVKK